MRFQKICKFHWIFRVPEKATTEKKQRLIFFENIDPWVEESWFWNFGQKSLKKKKKKKKKNRDFFAPEMCDFSFVGIF